MANQIPTPQAQAWMNATYVILTLMTRRAPRFDKLGGTDKNPESIKVTRTILANSWGINNPAELRATLVRLRDGGDRARRQPNANDGLGPQGLLAWDLVRLNAVAGWGFMADFIPEAEAWAFIGWSSLQLQQGYQSFEELGQAYTRGVYAWDQSAGPDCATKVQQLMADAQSPWRTLDWRTNLGQWPPPQPGSATDLAAGTFDLGGGQQLKVKINGKSPEQLIKDKASQMIWGWIIGAIILGIIVIGGGGFAFYMYRQVKNGAAASGPAGAGGPGAAAQWDGKTTFECSGNQNVTLSGVTASVSGTAIKASGNCQLTLKDMNVTGAIAIEAGGNAQVTVTGGSLTGNTNSVVAGGNAHVTCAGTKVTGKSKTSGNAKAVGAN